MATFAELKTDLLEMVNRPSSDDGNKAARSLNAAAKWGSHMHDFKYLERMFEITIPANTTQVTITSACSLPVKSVISAQLISATGEIGEYLNIKEFQSLSVDIQRFQNRAPVNDMLEQYSYDISQAHSTLYSAQFKFAVSLMGTDLRIYPKQPEAKLLLIHANCGVNKMTADTDTNMLTEYLEDWLLLRAAMRYQYYLKNIEAVQVNRALLKEEWEAALVWDSQLRTAQGIDLNG